MAISSSPIYADDITGSDSRVSLETGKSFQPGRPLASGWLTSTEVQRGFTVFAADYESLTAYRINTVGDPGFVLALNLGHDHLAGVPKREIFLPRGNFTTIAFDEPIPIKFHRGERRHQQRCGIWLDSDWIRSGRFEEFDDTGIVGRTVSRIGTTDVAAAPTALMSNAARLFAAFRFEGALAKLRLEAASLAFFAEAFVSVEDASSPRALSRYEAGRIARVKEMLDAQPADAEFRLVDLAAYHSMSVRSLSRHFRSTYGTTILSYITERRMIRAREAIEREGATVDQAAHMAGFAHTSNFSSAFRRRFGYSPGTSSRPRI